MIMQEPTEEMLKQWESLWNKYRDKLRPNRKTGTELLEYLNKKYVLTEIQDKSAADEIANTILQNESAAEKLPVGKKPCLKMYYIENIGAGRTLYKNQDLIFKDVKRIFVSIDLMSGCYHVEGSSLLWDELCAYQGLDKFDLENYACVAQYIECKSKFPEYV